MKTIFFYAVIIVYAFMYYSAMAMDNNEAEKIEFLISSVENLESAKFIRNNTEHDSKEAGKHLRMKLQKAENYIKDVNDFIRICSKSYITGKPYLIKFSDSRTVKAEKFFRKRLSEYNAN